MAVSELEERFANALHNCARAWRQSVDSRLKHLGVSQAGWMTIAVAAKAASPLSQSEIADRLGVEGATIVAMLDRLVKAGLVLREPSTTDRRINRIALTDAGRDLYETVRIEAVALRGELLSQVPTAELEVATRMLESLQGIIDALP